MSEVSNRRFVHFDGTKQEFIDSGYPETYNESIVFINGDGNESNNTIYTHGEYYGQGVIVEGDASNSAVLKGEYEGISNRALSQTSMAVGAGTTAGLKGWYYSKIDFTKKTITLSDKPTYTIAGTTLINGSWSSGTPNIKVNDVISLVNNSKYDLCSTVTAVSGNVITVNTLPFTALTKDNGAMAAVVTGKFSDGYSLCIPARPDAGIIDFGGGAFSEGGYNTMATNICAHAEGLDTHAYGQYSHAEGRETKAGYAAHAEGRGTTASGETSHAEGLNTIASAKHSHAEGDITEATGINAHAEGYLSKASGNSSHAEGGFWQSGKTGDARISGGNAEGNGSHAEGAYTLSAANYSHAEGYRSEAHGPNSHVEGQNTRTGGTDDNKPTAVGGNNSGQNAHAEGGGTFAQGAGSHSEGGLTWAKSNYSHAEGYRSVASGPNSHTEGQLTRTGGEDDDRPTGTPGEVSGQNAHAEGAVTFAQGLGSHAEGGYTWASGNYSHTEGWQTRTYDGANNSHAEGFYTETTRRAEHAEGEYNLSNGNTIHSVGIGTSSERKNAHEITITGKHYIFGLGGYNGKNSSKSKDLATILGAVDTSDKESFNVNGDLHVRGELRVYNNFEPSDDFEYISVTLNADSDSTDSINVDFHGILQTRANNFAYIEPYLFSDSDGADILWIIHDNNQDIFNPDVISNQIIRISTMYDAFVDGINLYVMIMQNNTPSPRNLLYDFSPSTTFETYETLITDNFHVWEYCFCDLWDDPFCLVQFSLTNNRKYPFIYQPTIYEFNYFAGEISCRAVKQILNY